MQMNNPKMSVTTDNQKIRICVFYVLKKHV